MYLRLDSVDELLDTLRSIQNNTQLCVNEIQRLPSTIILENQSIADRLLAEIQSIAGQRIAVCEEKLE